MNAGGAFEGIVDDVVSPFGYKRGEGIDAGFGEHDWICNRDRSNTDTKFESLSPVDGKITGAGEFECIGLSRDISCTYMDMIVCHKRGQPPNRS